MMEAAVVTAPPLGVGRACGKLILLGEHFVVHGTEALAVPLAAVGTTVEVRRGAARGPAPLRLESPDVAGPERAAAERLAGAALERLGLDVRGGWHVAVRSTIPVGHGLGSSAALAVALVRALAAAAGRALDAAAVNVHAHALETLVHGTPSGVDDTVVTLERPVRFRKGDGLRALRAGGAFGLVLGSCGHGGSTRDAVAGVAALRRAEPARFEALRAEAEEVIGAGVAAFEAGDAARLGTLCDRNHALLRAVGVSNDALDRLAAAARGGGALGAKMTGGGLGGFVLAVVPGGAATAERVAAALRAAGAATLLHAEVTP
jgi:mevalonate kinase